MVILQIKIDEAEDGGGLFFAQDTERGTEAELREAELVKDIIVSALKAFQGGLRAAERLRSIQVVEVADGSVEVN